MTYKETQIYSPKGYGFKLAVSVDVISTDIKNNQSTIKVAGSLTAQGSYWSSGYTSKLHIYWNGGWLAEVAFQGLANKNDVKYVEKTIVVNHNSDGTLRGYGKAYFEKGSTTSAYAPNSGSVQTDEFALPSIPRYTKITEFRVQSTTEKSLTIKWNADAACDAVQYQLNGGNWVSTAGTTFTINNLTPGTAYNIKIKVRRTDSQLWTVSNTITGSTKDSSVKYNVNGTFKTSVPYIKVNGVWKKARPFINIRGTWYEGRS